LDFNSLNGLFTPNNSQQFFETGREKLEQEIERLQVQEMPSEELLQIEETEIKGGKAISLQEVKTWCVNSEGNVVLKCSFKLQVRPQKPHPVIPRCHQLY
jgi:hypothetical protein